ncbi:MAG TPA: hypothetical protein VF210_11280 [Pseudomonadales bacterium]
MIRKAAGVILLTFIFGQGERCLDRAGLAIDGDGLLTLDTETGLEWLDWSYTINLSHADVASNFAPGGEFEGFRYATLSELVTLYTNVGFDP